MTTQNKLAEALRLAYDALNEARDFAQSTTAINIRAALAEHDATPAPTCPHCARRLEGRELARGLCTSDDCPRHDAAKALRGLVRATYHMTDTAATNGDAFPVAHRAARYALATYPDLPA